MSKKKNKDNPFKSRKAMKAMKKIIRKANNKFKEETKKNLSMLYGEPMQHDTAACEALMEYDTAWENPLRVGPGPNMGRIAEKYKTTIEQMKRHYPCIEAIKRLQKKESVYTGER